MAEFWRDANFPQLESRRSCQHISCYRPHTHERFSLGLIDAGTTRFIGYAGQSTLLHPGEVIIIPAGMIHSCNPQNGRWEYQMLQAEQDWIAPLIPEQSSQLLDGINVYADDELYRDLTELNTRLFDATTAPQIEREFREVFAKHRFVKPRLTQRPMRDQELHNTLRPVFEALREVDTMPNLQQLAELCAMNKYQLIRSVKRATGFTPVQWRLNHKVSQARTLLAQGASLSQTANDLGFADQSHLHRVFQAHVAATPGRYRG